MKFTVVKNGLSRDAEFKCLKLQSEEYEVRFLYYGEYDEDRENGGCDAGKLTMICKPRGLGFPLSLAAGAVLISIPYAPVLRRQEVGDFQQQLSLAAEAAGELERLLEEWFGITVSS